MPYTVGKVNNAKPEMESAVSTMSQRGLLQRKLFLMKMMLRNERESNKAMQKRIGELGRELHQNNTTL